MGLLEPWHIIIIIIVFGCIFGIPCAIIGSYRKIGAFAGFLLGLFLNIIGLIIVICLSPKDVQPFVYSNESIPDQLKKYKELLDSGAITEAEYNLQKSRLLNTPPRV
jgi:hypothetical protein